MRDLKRINLLYGSVRSGKTWISLLKWALWVGMQPKGQEFLMVGKTITTLKRNCLGLLENLVGSNVKYSISQKKATIFGRTVWLEGANDERSESKIRGMTLKGVYIDELTQIPKDFYLMALSRLSEKGAVLIATTNPDNPKHYVKTDIIDNDELDKQVIKFLIDDNIYLDEAYKENLKKEYTGVYYQRFINGDFVRAEGLVFRDFADDPTKHIIAAAEVPKEFQWCEVGFDIGGQGSHHSIVVTAKDDNGIYYVLGAKDVIPEDLNMSDIEKMVKNYCEYVENKYTVTINFINSDWIDIVINSINDHTGYRCGKTYKPSLEDRPFAINKMLAGNVLKFVDNECDPLIFQLQNAVFDEKSERAIICDDGTMCIDCIDAFVYSLAGSWHYLEV